jgi:hypothetical protein
MREDGFEFGAGPRCSLSEGQSSRSRCIAKEDAAGFLHGCQSTPLRDGMCPFGCPDGWDIDDVQKHDMFRLPTGERFQCLDAPP